MKHLMHRNDRISREIAYPGSSEISNAKPMKHLISIAVFLASFLWLASRVVSPAPYMYDEADYAFDARLGLAANYTDTPTLPFGEFLREGLSRGRSAKDRGPLSESIRKSNDVVFYRHWHGPLYFYWLIVDSGLAHSEREMRLFSILFPLLSLVVIYAGCLWVLAGTNAWPAAILASALFPWSWTTLGSTELAPHQLFATCLLAGLFCLVKMAQSGSRRFLYLACIAAGFAFCSLELTFALIATIVVCAVVERRRIALDWKTALRSVLFFFVTVFVLWPGAVLKLSFAKAYVFMAYLALVRKSPWGNEGLIGTWAQRMLNSPVEWVLIVLSLGLYLWSRTLPRRRSLYPFLVLAGITIIATLRVTTGSPRYGLPFMPALQVFAGLVLGGLLMERSRRFQVSAVTVLTAALFANAWFQVSRHPPSHDPQLTAVLNLIRDKHLADSAILVPQDYVPSIHFYFPETHLHGYFGVSPSPQDLQSNEVTGIFYGGNPVRYQPAGPKPTY